MGEDAMKRNYRFFLCISLLILLTLPVGAEDTTGVSILPNTHPIPAASGNKPSPILLGSTAVEESVIPGQGPGFSFGTGIQGIFSFYEAGFLFPRIGGSFFIDLKARLMSSLNWVTFINQETGENASFHPVTAAGVVSFGGYSPMLFNAVKMYGGTDLLFGYTFTPYDDYFYGTNNLIGTNLTFGVLGFFGLEFFTTSRSAFFLQAGGGYRGLKLIPPDPDNIYAVAASWLGSGFGIEMGMKLYL